MCTSRRRGRISRRDRCVTSTPRMRIVPAVGSTRRATQFADRRLAAAGLADEPEHLAGADRASETPSTAWTMPPPPVSCEPTWKCLTRPSTSRTAVRARVHSRPGWKHATRCAGGPRAAAGPRAGRRRRPAGSAGRTRSGGSGSASAGTSPGISCSRSDAAAGDRAQEADRVGVLRMREQLVHRRLLGLAPRVHDDDAVGDVGDDAEVVRDEDDRRAEPLADVAHEVEDPRLDRHVERRRRLVGDQDLRVAGERDRDHHALAHPARELVRVLVDPAGRRRDADEVEQLDRARARAARARGRGARCSTSPICWPTVNEGLSDVIGSWNTKEISRPRIRRSGRPGARGGQRRRRAPAR